MMLSPVEWVVEHREDPGQEVWIEVVEVIPDVLQDSEHYMQTEIDFLIFWFKGHFYAIVVIKWRMIKFQNTSVFFASAEKSWHVNF